MVIAHEITHGFDDQGRRFDADGALREWWTAEDAERFNALAERLVDQFAAYTVLDGVAVNGRLTLGENIADLGGMALAQRAHARVAADAPEIDGLTPAQRFFLANATLWRANISPDLPAHARRGSIRTARGSCACSARSRTWTRSGTPSGSPTTPRSCGRPRIASRSGEALGLSRGEGEGERLRVGTRAQRLVRADRL